MADDLGIGVVGLQGAEKGDEGTLLGRGAGVGITATFVETAFVADADGVGVVVAGVGTDLRLVAALVQLAVAGDVVVVATAFPAFCLVTGIQCLEREILVAASGAAVDDDEINASHLKFCL